MQSEIVIRAEYTNLLIGSHLADSDFGARRASAFEVDVLKRAVSLFDPGAHGCKQSALVAHVGAVCRGHKRHCRAEAELIGKRLGAVARFNRFSRFAIRARRGCSYIS